MKILLCAATEMEIAPTIQFLTSHEHPSMDVLITGIGLMTSTYALTKKVAIDRPDLIIQAGIAGTLNEDLPLTEVVVVRNETIGDLGVQESAQFSSLFDLKLMSPQMPPWKDGKLTNEYDVLNESGLKQVDGVTVNEISTREERIHFYRNHLSAEIETMEGAALHYVGLMEKIPFLQVRSVSNFIGERDKSNWMIDKAVIRLNQELKRILTKY